MEAQDLTLFIIGGWVRDRELGKESHDLDLVCTNVESLDHLTEVLEASGGVVRKRNEETMTLVTQLPECLSERFGVKFADIVKARKDIGVGDGRHPAAVEAGTLLDDQTRRDFTVNSIAFDDLTGTIHDPHGGRQDLRDGILRFVGDPMERIREDALRVLRALRFSVTKGLAMTDETFAAVNSEESGRLLLEKIPVERVDTEITRMLAVDTLAGMKLLVEADKLHGAIFRDGFHLAGSLKLRKVAQ